MSRADAFKETLGNTINHCIRIATQEGLDEDEICRVLSAQMLVIAADLHFGNDESFLKMAQRSLALIRTGAPEQ